MDFSETHAKFVFCQNCDAYSWFHSSLVLGEAPEAEVLNLSDAFCLQDGGLDHVVADAGECGLLHRVPEDEDGEGQH